MAEIAKPLLQKLGVKDGIKIAVLGFQDHSFMQGVPFDTCLKEESHYNLILIQTNRVEDLRSVQHPKGRLALKGALWIVYPKGVKTITQNQVMFAGRVDGFTDIKVCSFSGTHTGLKFVRRKTPAR